MTNYFWYCPVTLVWHDSRDRNLSKIVLSSSDDGRMVTDKPVIALAPEVEDDSIMDCNFSQMQVDTPWLDHEDAQELTTIQQRQEGTVLMYVYHRMQS